MKLKKGAQASVTIATAITWSLSLAGVGLYIASSGNALILAILYPLIFISVTFALILAVLSINGLASGDPSDERYTTSIFARAISIVILAAILICTYATIKSFWFSPLADDYPGRFVYENIATVAGIIGLSLTFILSSLQKNIYWATRKNHADLDERQIQDRRNVFEKSYKIAAVLVLVIAWFFTSTVDNISTIISYHHNTIPGHLYWLPINLALTLFALPLILAAWKDTSAKVQAKPRK